MSIHKTTVDAFCAVVGGSEPVPAGVSISAVSAALALSLLAKVLDITARRKNFIGDHARIEALINSSRTEAAALTQLADDDVRAFNEYLACSRASDEKGAAAAMHKAIEIPMQGARAALRGLDHCAECVGIVRGLAAADLGIAATLLRAAIRAMLISVDFNCRKLDSTSDFARKITAERNEIELQAARQDEAIESSVRVLLL
jgi:formiminotetrahydrofolate cyclodeaminase